MQRGLGGLVAGIGEESQVELFGEIVPALVEFVDRPLDARDPGVRGGWIAGRIFFMPEVKVGAVLVEHELLEGGGGRRRAEVCGVPVSRGEVVENEDAGTVKHAAKEGQR